jgi:hypothetical protein
MRVYGRKFSRGVGARSDSQPAVGFSYHFASVLAFAFAQQRKRRRCLIDLQVLTWDFIFFLPLLLFFLLMPAVLFCRH